MGVQSFGNPAASFRGRFGRTGKRAANPVILSTILSVTKPDTTTTTVDLATADFNFAVAGPYTVTISNPASVLLKTWGAGGRNDYITVDSGGGGYAEGTMTLQSGTTYYVVVGSGGGTAPTYAPGNAPVPYGGGGAHNNPVGGGPGGGFSGLFISSVAQANSILIAGGGGGCYGNGSGGGGGGTTGQNGGGYTAPAGGGGGTQSAGGAGGIGGGNNGTAGSALTGGKGGTGPGASGGGGGYYGGGGGGGGTGSGDYGAGGGGSGYTNPTYISSPVLTQATSYLAANNSNPDRQNAGNGASATPANGQPGRFIIRKL